MWFVVALMTLASVFGPGFERGRPERRTPEAPSFSGASALDDGDPCRDATLTTEVCGRIHIPIG